MAAWPVISRRSNYVILNAAMTDSSILTVILALTAAKRFKMEKFMALAVAFCLGLSNIAASFTAAKPLYTLYLQELLLSQNHATFLVCRLSFLLLVIYQLYCQSFCLIWVGSRIENSLNELFPCCQSLCCSIFFVTS